ncbi:hypothetical protein Tco_0128447 [Tanacetum coccineum]
MVPFIKELGYNGKCDMLSEIHTDHMHQPWRTFTAVINRCISGKSPDFMFQADNKEISSARKENMPYPRFTKVIISLLISKDKTIFMRNKINLHTIRGDSLLSILKFVSKTQDYHKYRALIPEEIINQAIKDSKSYKIYLAYATGVATPKKARKFKKPASPWKKKTLVTVEEEELEPTKKDKPTKKPTTKRQSSGVQIQDTPGVSVSKKKTPVKVSRRKGIELLSDATLLEEARSKKALRRSKRETTIIQAGGSSEGADFESVVPDEPKVKTSLADNGDDDDSNDDDSNDDVSDDEDVLESDDDHEEADDERIESDDEEEEAQDDDLLTKKGDVEMTNTKTGDAELENAKQVMLSLSEGPILSSYISSDYDAKYLNFDNIPSVDTKVVLMLDINVQHEVPPTTSTTVVSESETLAAFHSRITNLVKDVKDLKMVDHSEVPNAVKEYLGTSLDDALYKVLKKHDADIIKEHSVPDEIIEIRRHQYVPKKCTEHIRKIKMEHARKQQEPKETISSFDTTALEEFDQKTTLFETMTKSKSFNKSPKQRALYHALMESILEDEDAMDEGVADKLKKRKQDDADKDEGPSAGSYRGLKRRKTSKDTEPSKKGTSKSQPKSTVKSASAEPSTLDSDWNVRKSIDFRPPQTWINKIAQAEKPPLSFDELMRTPIEFSTYVMNHLKIDKLTLEYLVGSTFNLLKGTCKSRVELEYNFEECYKALTGRLDWNNPERKEYPFDLSKPLPLIMNQGRQVVPVDYFINNDLEYLRGGSSSKKYTTSTTKTKAAMYDIPGIKDMVSSLWSPVKKLSNLERGVIFDLGVALWMFTRRIVILKRVEDLQQGVKSYQKKLNITKPETFRSDISNRTPYTTYNNPQGIIYLQNLGRMYYAEDKIGGNLDRQRSRIMIKAIDKLLLEIRLMRSLKKFVGGRDYGEDLRLLERTI